MVRIDLVPVVRRYVVHARLLWRSTPGLSLGCLGLTVVAAGAGTAALVTTGRLVGSLPEAIAGGFGSPAADTAWRWLVATAVLFLLAPAVSSMLVAAGQAVSARYLAVVLDSLMEAGTGPYGVAHLEDPRWAGRAEAVGRAPRDWLFLEGVDATWRLLSIRLGGVGAFAVLATWAWWAPIPLVAGWLVLSKGFARWSSTLFDELLDVTGNDRRRAGYLRSLLTGSSSAKEVRLFGLPGWLVDRYVTAWQRAMAAVWANRNRGLRITLATVAAPLTANAVVVALLARDAWTGAIGVGAVVTFGQAVLALEAFGPEWEDQEALARTIAAVTETTRLRNEQQLPAVPPRWQGDVVRRGSNQETGPAATVATTPTRIRRTRPDPSAAAIDLTGVTFGYPAQDRPVFAGLTLQIPAGQSVALVGLNGAGKSTLIKLLCGLYRPDKGSVRIDGADPGVDEWARRRVGVIFQDFVRYHLPLRDNIAAGASGYANDQALLDRALADTGGADLLARLGWDTVLSSEYTGGTDLSGGQWQRVALARALAALGAGAGLLVLDEPTAALDIRAEAALFDRFLTVARGATTLLVSHRLSSVRRAERVLVLADPDGAGARIVEDGAHDQLLAMGGVYAELFTLQASRFAGATEGR